MGCICREILSDLRPEEINEQRYHQSPSEYAASELHGCEPKSDDVTDSQISGTYTRCGESNNAACCHNILASGSSKPDPARSKPPHDKVKNLAGSGYSQVSDGVDNPPNLNFPKT